MSKPEQVIRTTCPRDCYDSCGVEVHIRDGAIASVRGDPNHFVTHGRLCTKCSIGYNQEWISPKARLTRPLRRVGPKGQGRFEPVSWDVALSAIAERLKKIVATSGGSNYFQHALYRYNIFDCIFVPDAFLQQNWRDGSSSGHYLQYGWTGCAAVCLWDIVDWIRPAHG